MGTHIMSERSLPSGDRDSSFSPRKFQSEPDRYRRYQEGDTSRQSHSHRAQIDQIQKFAGLTIGFSSIFAEHVLSHPCIVLRRQCQVNHNGGYYHLTPFTLFPVILNLQRHQGMQTMWKGIGSVFVVRGIFMGTEAVISELTPFPREVSRHSAIKKYGEHLLLKGFSYLLTTPFYAASLIETIQSDIASEKPGVLDVIKEGVTRLAGWGMPQSTRLLPLWKLAFPTAAHHLAHYVINSIAQYTVISTIKSEQQEMRDPTVDDPEAAQTVYDIYFPDLLASFTGSLLADFMLFPIETVLHRLYVQGTRTIIDNTDSGLGVIPINTRYEGFMDCFKNIVAEEGLPGLYRGFGALVLQYALHAFILRTAKYLFERLSEEFQSRPQSSQRRSEAIRP